jgi:hypothetical protein
VQCHHSLRRMSSMKKSTLSGVLSLGVSLVGYVGEECGGGVKGVSHVGLDGREVDAFDLVGS